MDLPSSDMAFMISAAWVIQSCKSSVRVSFPREFRRLVNISGAKSSLVPTVFCASVCVGCGVYDGIMGGTSFEGGAGVYAGIACGASF